MLNLDLHRVFKAFVGVLIVVGLFMVYIIAPYSTLGPAYGATPFTNVAIAALLMLLANTETVLIPNRYRIGLRSIATMLFLAYCDQVFCEVSYYVTESTAPAQVTARGTLRFGACCVVISSLVSLLYVYCTKVPQGFQMPWQGTVPAMIARSLRVMVVGFLVLAQIAAWSMTNMCHPSVIGLAPFPGFSPIVLAFLFAIGCLLDDKESFDLSFVYITAYVFYPGVVVDSSDATFQSLWMLHAVSLLIAALAAGSSVMAELCTAGLPKFHAEVATSPRTITQAILFAFGVIGSICVYVESPGYYTGYQENWNFSFGFVLPLLMVLYHLTQWAYFRGVAVILTLPVSVSLAASCLTISSSSTVTLNAGMLLCLLSASISVAVDLILECPLELRPVNEYIQGSEEAQQQPSSSARNDHAAASSKFYASALVLLYTSLGRFNASDPYFVGFFIAGVFLVIAHEGKLSEVHRILFFVLVKALFSVLWPLSDGASVLTVLPFLVIMWFAFHYLNRYEDVYLRFLWADETYEAAVPFNNNDPHGKAALEATPYQRVPSNPTERSSLIVQQPAPQAYQYSNQPYASGQGENPEGTKPPKDFEP